MLIKKKKKTLNFGLLFVVCSDEVVCKCEARVHTRLLCTCMRRDALFLHMWLGDADRP